jgi:hypothetical protein
VASLRISEKDPLSREIRSDDAEWRFENGGAFLPILDDLERALTTRVRPTAYARAMNMIFIEVLHALWGLGVKKINALGR